MKAFRVACFIVIAFCLLVPSSEAAEWTFMVYLTAENNLEPDGIDDFLEMAQAGSDTNMNILVQMDRIDGHDDRYGDWKTCKRFRIEKNMEPVAGSALADVGEVNMGDPAILKGFIEWGVANYPAQRYALILWDHGDGWRRGTAPDESPFKAVCGDDTDGGDHLYMKEIHNTLDAISTKMDLIGFDACLMGMLEVAYELKDTGASVMVGSEELEPGGGWPYHTVLEGLAGNPSWTAAQLGSWIVDKYYESYNNNQTQSVVDLSRINALGTAVSDLADKLRTSWNTDQAAVKSAAGAVMSQVENAVIHEKHGDSWRGAKGVAIYFPAQSSDFNPDYAARTIDFAANTYWDEFLGVYYSDMQGSWIEAARTLSVKFQKDYGGGHIDLHNFCSYLGNPPDTDPGYTFQQTAYQFEDISASGENLNLLDETYLHITPADFAFSYLGAGYTGVSISDNGVIYFEDRSYGYDGAQNKSIPGCALWGEKFLAPLWTDLDPSQGGGVYYEVRGTGTDRRLILQWNDIKPYDFEGMALNGLTFQAVMYENGTILFSYQDTVAGNADYDNGSKATVGIQGGLYKGLQYSFNTAKVNNSSTLRYTPAGGDCVYSLSATGKSFSGSGGSGSVTVSTDAACSWTSASGVSWVTITDGKTGSGGGTVKYSVAANTGLSSRAGELTIAGQAFTVTQASSCVYTISPESASFSSQSANAAITVTTGNGCAWTASSHNDWITITSGGSGAGGGTVNYTVAANTGTGSRTGSITAAGKNFVITQSGAPAPEAVNLENGSIVKNLSQWLAGKLYYKIDIPTGTQTLQFRVWGGSGDCNLFVRQGALPTAAGFDQKSENSGNNETIGIENPQSGLWYIMLYAKQAFGGVSLSGSYNAAGCAFATSPSSGAFTAAGGDGSLNITAASECAWTVFSANSWIRILSAGAGSGNGKVDYEVSPNPESTERAGAIQIMDQIFNVTQSGQTGTDITPLTNDVAKSGLSGDSPANAYFSIDVPSGQARLTVDIWGGSGDCDLYVRYGETPTLELYDQAPFLYGNDEQAEFDNPSAGLWYIMLHAYEDYSDVSLKASYTDMVCSFTLSETDISAPASGQTGTVSVTASDSGCAWSAYSDSTGWLTVTSGASGTGNGEVGYAIAENTGFSGRSGTIRIGDVYVSVTQQGTAAPETLENNVAKTGISGMEDDWKYYQIELPENQTDLSISIQGDDGDADLYVKYGSIPTYDDYDFNYYIGGSNENAHISPPQAGVWYIGVHGYTAYSRLSLIAIYTDAGCRYTMTSYSASAEASGGTGTVNVNVETGCPWTVMCMDTWLSAAGNAGDGSFSYTVEPNDGDTMRAGNIKIADQWMTVFQAGQIQTEPETLASGAPLTSLADEWFDGKRYYQIEVPPGQEYLTASTSGGSGDCDLFIRYSAPPSWHLYDRQSANFGNEESVTISYPASGTWYIMLLTYDPYSNMNLDVEFGTSGESLANAVTLLQILCGITPLQAMPLDVLDCNKDSVAGMDDAVYFLQYTSGLRNHVKHREIPPALTKRPLDARRLKK